MINAKDPTRHSITSCILRLAEQTEPTPITFHPHDPIALHAPHLTRMDILEVICGRRQIEISRHDHVERHDVWWCDRTHAFGYQCPLKGWIPLHESLVKIYQFKPAGFMRWLQEQLGITATVIEPLNDSSVYSLGTIARLQSDVSFIYAQNMTPEKLQWCHQKHNQRHPLVVLSGTPTFEHQNDSFTETTVISLHEIMTDLPLTGNLSGPLCTLDLSKLWSLIHARSNQEPLNGCYADGGIVIINGMEYEFHGSKQKQLIQYLWEAREQGERFVGVEKMFEDLDMFDSRRLLDIFRRNPDWTDVIGTKRGICWLKL